MITESLAVYLNDLGLVNYQPDNSTGNCFINKMPAEPDFAVSIVPLGGVLDRGLYQGTATWKIVVRGPKGDPEPVETLLNQITDHFYNMNPEETFIIAPSSSLATTIIMATPTVPYTTGWDVLNRIEMVLRITFLYSTITPA